MVEFGFPRHIAEMLAARPVMIVYPARATVIGLTAYTFYFQRKVAEMSRHLGGSTVGCWMRMLCGGE